MLLKEMYLKPINRDIRGVIKADQIDEEDVYQELEEYVVTRELHDHFAKFYDNYLKSVDGKTDKVGVWISGFFGSGKSHFLKILSYLLANKPVKGKYPVEFFKEKINDPIMYANMERTAKVPTETILFNIDSKSPLGNKNKEDAILCVLLKVFNEHRGYYGDNPIVANLEKYLDQHGYYESFKKAFEKIAPEPWVERRNSFAFDTHYIKEALFESTDMTEEAIDNWLTHSDHVDISIEQFAKEVKEYIDSKEPGFHLVFLIDEIGQYIGDRRDLMLNLQTVTENLGAICQGQAWIMVTSQESIDTLVKVKGDDFSRIQGRFDTRLSLSSISVDEVIQKRILDKKDFAIESLKATYPEKGPILRNLISFVESTGDLGGFTDEKQFANIYPFVPYQFNLLQLVFEQVRKHAASSGKHISEGERSMLSAFREAGTQFMNEKVGALIPFHSFYDAITEFLQPTITRVIERAAENRRLKDDPFHIELLKVLFLIKYVDQMPANLDNLATLMVSHIDEDKLALKERIKKSLRKLENEILIQKNGDEYDFLTDDEQDINREIKEVKLPDGKVEQELAEYVLEDLYDTKRYNYNRLYNFSFNRTMDERHYGNQTAAIGINILSSLSDHYDKTDQELMLLSSRDNDLVVKLGGDEQYVEELEEVLKIESYRQKRLSRLNELPENIQNILNNKNAEARERRMRTRNMLEEALKQATFFVNGNKIEITGSSVRDRINNAFKVLVEDVYTNLNDIKDFIHDEKELKAYLTANLDQLTLDADELGNPNERATQSIEEYIRLQTEMNEQIRVKPIYDRYSGVPYGWRTLDIAQILAYLLKEQRIRIRYNGEYLEPKEDANTLITVFTRTGEADKAIVELREQVDEHLIRKVRMIARDLFDKADLKHDEDGLIGDIRHLIEKTEAEIELYKARYEGRKYPGESLLDKGIELFSVFNKRIDNLKFFTKFKEAEDSLADWFDDIQSVKNFFGSNQKSLFDDGIEALNKYEEVKSYVQTDDVSDAMEKLSNIISDPIPYRKIKDIPKYVNVLDEEVDRVLQSKKRTAQETIKIDYDEISLQANQYDVTKETQRAVERQYEAFFNQIELFTDIYKIDAIVTQSNNFKRRMSKQIGEEIKARQKEREEEQKKRADQYVADSVTATKPIIQTETVKLSQLINVTTLKTEQDVEKYISTLENKLKEIIQSNKEIELID